MKFISSTNKSRTRNNARFYAFLRGEVGDFAFLGCHASSVVSRLQTFGTTYCFNFQRSRSLRRKIAWPVIMGVIGLLETLVINDELWVKSWRLLMVYKHAVNSDDSKRSTKYRKYKLDCFAVVILVMLQKSLLICQVKFRHSHIFKQNFWHNFGWWYTVYRNF
jgi:hypothetical protein